MIGYSDSNKDAGYLAANWALYQAQEKCSDACRAHNVKLTLFHGRGGTIARGGGPANRAIRAQPPGSINGRFRLTEQGEMLAARYANPELAHRHLEQIVSAVVLASIPDPASPDANVKSEWREAMTSMSVVAHDAYRAFVYGTSGFVDFWRAVTPFDEIRSLMIGSRPVLRGGSDVQIARVRAIPPGGEVLCISRIILAEGRPVAFLVDTLPEKIISLDEFQADFRGSILDLLLRRGQPPILASRTEINAVSASTREARALGIHARRCPAVFCRGAVHNR